MKSERITIVIDGLRQKRVTFAGESFVLELSHVPFQ